MKAKRVVQKFTIKRASLALTLFIISLFTASVSQAQTFTDVGPNEWYAHFIEDLVTKGIIDLSMPEYRPADFVDRAEMAKFVVKAFNIPLINPDQPTFKDVPKNTWYYQYVESAAAKNIITGYKDQNGNLTGYYGPTDPLTRGQAMKMIVLSKPLMIDTNMSCNPGFSDISSSESEYQFIVTGWSWSIIDGYPDGKFKKDNNLNRAEIAKIIANSLNPIKRPCNNLQQTLFMSGKTGDVIQKKIQVKAKHHYTLCLSPETGDPDLWGSSVNFPVSALTSEEKSEHHGLWNGGPLLHPDCITFNTASDQGIYYIAIPVIETFTGKLWYTGTPLDNVPLGFEKALTKPLDVMALKNERYGSFGSPWGNALKDPFENPEVNGYLHSGDDFKIPAGTPVKAACDGKIVKNGILDNKVPSEFGWYTVLECSRMTSDSKNTTLTIGYVHLIEEERLEVGTSVKAGQIIGKVYAIKNLGEVDHLHLTLCLGTYTQCETANQKPQRGSMYYKQFPGLWINPDPITNPGLYLDMG